jgi:hypothetical protein
MGITIFKLPCDQQLFRSKKPLKFWTCVQIYRIIINDCLIAEGVGDVVECAASFITWVRLVSPIGGTPGGTSKIRVYFQRQLRPVLEIQTLCIFGCIYLLYNLNLKIFTETRPNRQQRCMSILRY